MFLLKSEFTGSFSEDSQISSVPETLLALMEMILNGPNLGNCGRGRHQASLTLAQLASFNAVRKARPNTATIKHSKERETLLPVYVGLTVHAQTRKKELVAHGKSGRHMKCRDSMLGSVLVGTRTIPSTFEAQETRQESANVYKTKVKINTAYCITKEEMPFTRMKPLILLQKKNGLDISPTYDNDVRCAELV